MVDDVIERREIVVREDDSLFGYTHTFPCPVCRKRYAILNGIMGVFEPCYDCQSRGWFLVDIGKLQWWQFWGLWRYLKSRIQTADREQEVLLSAGRLNETSRTPSAQFKTEGYNHELDERWFKACRS